MNGLASAHNSDRNRLERGSAIFDDLSAEYISTR